MFTNCRIYDQITMMIIMRFYLEVTIDNLTRKKSLPCSIESSFPVFQQVTPITNNHCLTHDIPKLKEKALCLDSNLYPKQTGADQRIPLTGFEYHLPLNQSCLEYMILRSAQLGWNISKICNPMSTRLKIRLKNSPPTNITYCSDEAY